MNPEVPGSIPGLATPRRIDSHELILFLFCLLPVLRFVRGRRTGISSATARNSRHNRNATRAVFTQPTRTRTHLPAPHGKAPSFLSFPPMILGAHPVSRLQPASRALTRTRAHYAHLSQFQKKAFTSSPTSRISLLHSGLRVKTLLFFPSALSSRGFTPKVKNIRCGFSPKTGTNREETRGSKTVKAKVKEKSKSLHP